LHEKIAKGNWTIVGNHKNEENCLVDGKAKKPWRFAKVFLACGIFFFPFLPPFIAAFRARPFIQMFVFAPVYFPLLSPFRSHACSSLSLVVSCSMMCIR
jgi:hypothetical protein